MSHTPFFLVSVCLVACDAPSTATTSAPAPATQPGTSDEITGQVSDAQGAPLDATIFLLSGAQERHVEASGGQFSIPDPEASPSWLQILPDQDAIAGLEAPLGIPEGLLQLEIVLPGIPLQPLPEQHTPLELGAGVQLSIGGDVLLGLGIGDVGAALLSPDVLEGFAAVPGEPVLAWSLAPFAVATTEPLDLHLSADVPDGSYRLYRSGAETWIELAQLEARGGALSAPGVLDRLGVLVLARD